MNNKNRTNQIRQLYNYLLNLGRASSEPEGSQNNVSINHN